jgi:3-oxoacyl-[acyl-carrier protein] reductase
MAKLQEGKPGGDYSGRVVLVTGAGRGLGRSLAKTFAARGAIVAINDITPINLDDCEAEIRESSGNVHAYVEDISKKMPVQTLLNSVLDDMGRLDIVVNCAEVKPARTLLEMDDWEWQRTLDVNLTGAFLLTQSAGRIMKERGGGTIVHLGVTPESGDKQAAFIASKAGLEAFVAQAQKEFSPHGIRVDLFRTESEALEICRQ